MYYDKDAHNYLGESNLSLVVKANAFRIIE